MVKTNNQKLRIHYIRHVPFEGLGRIENWAQAQGHKITSSLMYEDGVLPELEGIDWLVVMGGPMGTYDEDKYDWLAGEKVYIAEAIKAEKVVIGICLGAQIIAEITGGEVFKGEYSEIGWHQVKLTEEAQRSPLFSEFPEKLYVLQWHGDSFTLPESAIRVIEGEVYENQAFMIGSKILGLQFHLEFDAACMKRLYKALDGQIGEGPYIQTEEEVFAADQRFIYSEKLLHSLLEKLVESQKLM